MFGDWGYKVGLRLASDHAPLLGGFASVPKPKNAPLRFQKMRPEHPTFMKVVENSWAEKIHGDAPYIFMTKLKFLKHILKDWNWKVFGDVKLKIQEAEDNVKAKMIHSDAHPHNEQALEDLVASQNEDNSREVQYNTMLKKKSIIKWEVEVNDSILDSIPKLITENDQFMLEVIPEADEIKVAVFEMDGDSAPGPDSFSGMFYQACWQIIQDDFVNVVQSCWRRKYIPKGLNSNFLVLLPKSQSPKQPNQFRPIGLSNFSFKVFTKILSMRMASLMNKLVSSQQVAYIKGRSIHEQVLLASELVNEMKKKRRGGNFSLKLDITQAYDSVRWVFLFKVFQQYGFSLAWCDWLKELLSSTKISVMVNGGPNGFFSMHRGLNQGDPLSPILFVFMEEVLSKGLQNMVEKNKLQPMLIRNGISHTHLLFVDDVFIFCNGSKKNLQNLLLFLKDYQRFSGQMDLTSFPDKYLGVIIHSGRIKTAIVYPMVEMMQDYLAVWKVKFKDKNRKCISQWKLSSVCPGLKWACPIIESIGFTDYVKNNIQMKVKDLLHNGIWKIPIELQSYINSPLPIVSGAQDSVIWCGDTKGNFSTALAVNVIRFKQPKLHWPVQIWKHFLHSGISSNIWKIQQGVFVDDQKRVTSFTSPFLDLLITFFNWQNTKVPLSKKSGSQQLLPQ
ncbi:uncharacterized protein LOC113272535 [Papaver somniferum]|uniref:uncharacterized protein LOC113272535 n=1 Tax=Papaver somniferum TaxID=3469 RepID=UPI000E6FB447|nr:uncharacterized protein LOC113272535 [Papaver somniferum]